MMDLGAGGRRPEGRLFHGGARIHHVACIHGGACGYGGVCSGPERWFLAICLPAIFPSAAVLLPPG